MDRPEPEASHIVGCVEGEALDVASTCNDVPGRICVVEHVEEILHLLGRSAVREVNEGQGNVNELVPVIRNIHEVKPARCDDVEHCQQRIGVHFRRKATQHHLVHGWDRITDLYCYALLALSAHKNVKCYPTMTKSLS